MRKTPPARKRAQPCDELEPLPPLSDADRLLRGLPLESGEPQPAPSPRRIH
jgi:hypothetical protein